MELSQENKLEEMNFAAAPSPCALPWAVLRIRRLWTGQVWLDDAGIVVASGRIRAVGPWRALRQETKGPCLEMDGLVVPGLVNAHTHLELSGLAGQVPLEGGFALWAEAVARPDFWDEGAVRAAMAAMGLAEYRLVLDVATRAVRPMAGLWEAAGAWEYGLLAESLSSRTPRAWVPELEVRRGWLAPAGHSLYATAPAVLQGAKAWCRAQGRLFAIHAAERPEELALARQRWGEAAVGGVASVVAALDRLGLLDAGTLVVHGVHLTSADVALLARRRAVVCLCPRSNAALGVGQAPWTLLDRAGVGLALGTDSLASAPDLDLWQELAFLHEHLAPELSLERAVELVTGHALGLGRIEPGAPAALAVVPGWLAERFA